MAEGQGAAAESMTNEESMDSSYQLDFEMSASHLDISNDSPRNKRKPSTLAHNSTSQLETGFVSSPRWRSSNSMKSNHDSLPCICAGVSSSGSLLRSNFKAQTKGSSTTPWQLPQVNSNETPEWLRKLKNKGGKDGTDGAKPNSPDNNSTPSSNYENVAMCNGSSNGRTADEQSALPEWKRKFLEMKLSGRVLADSDVTDDPNSVTSNLYDSRAEDSGTNTPLWKRKLLQDKTASDAANIHENLETQASSSSESQTGECSWIPAWKLSILKSRQMQAELLSLGKQANEDRIKHPDGNSVPTTILNRLHAENMVNENNSSVCKSPSRRRDNVPEWMKKFQSMNFEKEEKIIEAGGKQDPSVVTNGNGVVVSWMRTSITAKLIAFESSEEQSCHLASTTDAGDKCVLRRKEQGRKTEATPVKKQNDVYHGNMAEPTSAGGVTQVLIFNATSQTRNCTASDPLHDLDASKSESPPVTEISSSNCTREAERPDDGTDQPILEPVGIQKKKKKKKVKDVEILESTGSAEIEASLPEVHGPDEAQSAMNDSFIVHDLVSAQDHPRKKKKKKGKKGLQDTVENQIIEQAAVECTMTPEETEAGCDDKGTMHELHSSQDTEYGPNPGSGERRKKKKKKINESYTDAVPAEAESTSEHRQRAQDHACMNESFSSRDSSGDAVRLTKSTKKKKEHQGAVDRGADGQPPMDDASTKPSLSDSFSSRESSQAQSSEGKVRRRKKKKNGIEASLPDHEIIEIGEAQESTPNLKSSFHESFSSGGESLQDDDCLSGEGLSSIQADSSRCGSKSSGTTFSSSSSGSSKARKQRLEEREQIVNTLKAFLEQSKSRIAERNLKGQDSSMLPNPVVEQKPEDDRPKEKQKTPSKDKRQPPRKTRSRTGNGKRESPQSTSVRRSAPHSPTRRPTNTKKHGSRRSSIKKSDPPASIEEQQEEEVFRVVSRNASFQMSMQKVSLPVDFDDFDEDQDFSDHNILQQPSGTELETDAFDAFSNMMEAEEVIHTHQDLFNVHDIHRDVDQKTPSNGEFFGFHDAERNRTTEDPFGVSGEINLDETEFSEDPFGASGTFGDSFGDTDCPLGFDSVTHVTDSTWETGALTQDGKCGRRRSLELTSFSACDATSSDRRAVERKASGSSGSRRKSMTAAVENHKSSRRSTTRTSSSNRERSKR